MAIQDHTGIRRDQQDHVFERSYVFNGSVLYLVLVFGFALFIGNIFWLRGKLTLIVAGKKLAPTPLFCCFLSFNSSMRCQLVILEGLNSF